jgi:hypothetical protein
MPSQRFCGIPSREIQSAKTGEGCDFSPTIKTPKIQRASAPEAYFAGPATGNVTVKIAPPP